MTSEPLDDLPRDAVNPDAYLVAEYFPDEGGKWYLTSLEHPGIVALAGELMLAGWDVRRVTPD